MLMMEVGDQWQHRVGGAQRELQEAVLQLLGLEFEASQQYSPYLQISALIKGLNKNTINQTYGFKETYQRIIELNNS